MSKGKYAAPSLSRMEYRIDRHAWDALTQAGELAEPQSIALKITQEGREYRGVAYLVEDDEPETHKLKALLANALYTNEAHHKQWYLWRIVEVLGLDLSDQWDEEYPEPEKGIAP